MNNIRSLVKTAFVLGHTYGSQGLSLQEALALFDEAAKTDAEIEKENNDLLEQGLHNDFTP
jgi:hypothetical protein